ncbi:MAG: hypothetical protein WKF40_00505 [Thermoleophilaceae bacterium]
MIKLRVRGLRSSALGGTATRTVDVQTPTIAPPSVPGSPPSNVRAPTIQGSVRAGRAS